ncbi:MAG: sulfite exporter TauE/SafE family protein [Acidobacteria bacterium]|nr:sulfite exporter TauE/SafE family protein [Acidobacteriota bacterium]
MIYSGLLALGLCAGVLAGMFGIGGGVIIAPALLLLFRMEDRAAFGTCLAALIPPVGLLGAIEYYRGGYVNIRYAALIALGLLIGGYFGARLMLEIPPGLVKKLYAGFLALIAVRMFFEK